MTVRTASKHRSRDPQAVRRKILDVAAAAFQTRGYHSTSTHEIVSLAGVTGGALHHHFPTKKALGLAVIRDRVGPAIEQTWIDPMVMASTTVDGVRTIFDQVADALDQRGQVFGCPLSNLALELSGVDADFRRALQEVFGRWRSSIEQKLRTDQHAGRLPRADPKAMALFIVGAYSGAMAIAKTDQSSTPLRTCAQQLEEILNPGFNDAA